MFLVFCQKLKLYRSLKFLLTHDLMGLDISRRYSYNFQPISAKPYEDIAHHGGIQAVSLLGNRPSFNFYSNL